MILLGLLVVCFSWLSLVLIVCWFDAFAGCDGWVLRFCLGGVGLVMVAQAFGSSICPSACLFSGLYVISFCDFYALCSLVQRGFGVWWVSWYFVLPWWVGASGVVWGGFCLLSVIGLGFGLRFYGDCLFGVRLGWDCWM